MSRTSHGVEPGDDADEEFLQRMRVLGFVVEIPMPKVSFVTFSSSLKAYFLSNGPFITADPARKRNRLSADHVGGAVKRGIEHAMAAGELLIEAKKQLDQHGKWMPWVTEHCAMSGRTARLYMRVARERAVIEAQNGNAANLSLRDAIALIAPAVERPDPAVDPLAWAEMQIEQPFTDWDFAEPTDWNWLQTKFTYCAGLPHAVRFALGTTRGYGLSTMAMCSGDEIMEALLMVTPYAKQKVGFNLDISTAALNAHCCITVLAQMTYVILFDEIKYREKRSDDRLDKKADENSTKLREAIEAKRVALDSIRDRLQPDMDWNDPVVRELRQLAGEKMLDAAE